MNPATADRLSPAARTFLDSGPARLFIGGEWVEPAGGSTFETYDPATGTPIMEVSQASAEDVDRAVTAASGALHGEWAGLPAHGRGVLMNRLADLIAANADELAELEALDNGKPLRMAKAVDVRLAIAHLQYFAGWPTKIQGATIPVSAPDTLVYTRREPVGVCAQIIPWNFPFLMAIWKIAPALAAGCTVVLKPAEQTPLTALRLAGIAAEAGVPAGVLNVLTGDGETGRELVRHPGVAKIAFTGSTAVGREIGEQAGRALKRVTLELGGKSPNIILPDADFAAAIKGSFHGIYHNTGQACNAGSRLFVPRDRYDEVVSGLVESVGRARLGPGLDEDTQFGPVVSQEQHERVLGYIRSGAEEGAEVAAGGADADVPADGWFVAPTLFTGVTDEMAIAREEIFGPVLVALPYDDLEEVARRANDTDYGLAAGVWTRDVASAHRLAAMLDAGTVYVNVWGLNDPAAPFGGYKASGIGREMGEQNLDAYLETKTVWTSLK